MSQAQALAEGGLADGPCRGLLAGCIAHERAGGHSYRPWRTRGLWCRPARVHRAASRLRRVPSSSSSMLRVVSSCSRATRILPFRSEETQVELEPRPCPKMNWSHSLEPAGKRSSHGQRSCSCVQGRQQQEAHAKFTCSRATSCLKSAAASFPCRPARYTLRPLSCPVGGSSPMLRMAAAGMHATFSGVQGQVKTRGTSEVQLPQGWAMTGLFSGLQLAWLRQVQATGLTSQQTGACLLDLQAHRSCCGSAHWRLEGARGLCGGMLRSEAELGTSLHTCEVHGRHCCL